MDSKRKDVLFHRFFIAAIILMALITLTAGFFLPQSATTNIVIQSRPAGIMGTDCLMGIILDRTCSKEQYSEAESALKAAENALRLRESATFSNWIADSEICRYNRGEITAPSSELAEVLAAAERARIQTSGAFDVSCRPIIELWKSAQKNGALPTDEQIEQARNNKKSYDLGGISKGYCIDKALRRLIQLNPQGAIVDIGGDTAVYGVSSQGVWTFSIVNPFDTHSLWGNFTIQTAEKTDEKDVPPTAAVCTSGGYYRGYTIGQQRFSHIINPQNARPIQLDDSTPVSVTVIASKCMEADVWATALSVLGEPGLEILPSGVQTYMIIGTPEKHRVVSTPGFPPVILK